MQQLIKIILTLIFIPIALAIQTFTYIVAVINLPNIIFDIIDEVFRDVFNTDTTNNKHGK